MTPKTIADITPNLLRLGYSPTGSDLLVVARAVEALTNRPDELAAHNVELRNELSRRHVRHAREIDDLRDAIAPATDNAGHAVKIARTMRADRDWMALEIDRLTRERDALRLENGQLAAKVATLEAPAPEVPRCPPCERSRAADLSEAFYTAWSADVAAHGGAGYAPARFADASDAIKRQVRAGVSAVLERLGATEVDRIAALTAALTDAIDLAVEGWHYAPDYFRDKWLSPDAIPALRAVIDGKKDPTP